MISSGGCLGLDCQPLVLSDFKWFSLVTNYLPSDLFIKVSF